MSTFQPSKTSDLPKYVDTINPTFTTHGVEFHRNIWNQFTDQQKRDLRRGLPLRQSKP